MFFFKLSAFYFFYFAAVGIYVIFLPKVLLDIGYSTSDIGIVLAIGPLMRFATPFLFLKHVKLDQGVFKIALITALVTAASFYLTIEYFYWFILSSGILGVCLSLLLPYIETIALQELGKQRYGKSRLYGSIGFMLVALILAKFLYTPYIALHYYLAMTLLTVIFSFSLLKYDGVHENNTKSKNKKSFSMKKYWPFWLSLFLMQVSFGGFYNFFTIYETSHGVSLEMTSYLWSFSIVCEVLILYFQAPLLKNNLITVIKICIFITSLRWLLLYLYADSLYVTFFTQALHAFSFGLYHSAVILCLYSLYKDKKLAQQFMFGVAYGLGGFMGALISGWLYSDALFLYSAIFALLSFFSMMLLKRKKRTSYTKL